ncbi:hypothetical protein [Novosphingobium sp.]|uniref:hypothetical protein n=1 Tax=Novosphingobium sp. TaxID=1874826 RepID=UPI0038BD1B09
MPGLVRCQIENHLGDTGQLGLLSGNSKSARMVKGKRIEPATIVLHRMPSAESRKIPTI